MKKESKVLVLSAIVLIGFVIAVFFHYALGEYLQLGHFYNTFLSSPDTAFSDFTSLLPLIKDLTPYAPPANWQNYFPLAFILIYPFEFFKNVYIAYSVFAVIFLGFFIKMNIKAFGSEKFSGLENLQNIFILTFLTYPLLYLMDRGNLDMIILMFLTGFAYCFESKKYKLSAFFLALANAMKPFGALFLIIFLVKKRYKEFFLNLGLTFLFITGGFLFFKGNVLYQMNILLQSWFNNTNNYVYLNDNSFGMVNGSSLFVFLKLLFCQLTPTPIISTFLLSNIYTILSIIITIAVVILTFKEKIYWKQLTLLTFYMVFIPTVMYDYKLIFLFIPLWFFIKSKEKSNFDLTYVILFGLFFLSKYLVIPEFLWGIEGRAFSISLILNPIIMVIFVSLIIYEQFTVRKN